MSAIEVAAEWGKAFLTRAAVLDEFASSSNATSAAVASLASSSGGGVGGGYVGTPAEALLQLRRGEAAFLLLSVFAIGRTLPACARFYAWFTTCGLGIGRHRGHGQAAAKMYGFVPAPSLTTAQFGAAGLALLGVLLAVLVAAGSARALLLALALPLYHLYFSQLYCEAHVGAHVTVLLPPALLLLSLSPAAVAGGDGEPVNAEIARAAAFTIWLVKVIVVSAYCGAGLSKTISSIKRGRAWWDGSTLQAYIFEAMYMTEPDSNDAFGLPTPLTYTLQRLVLPYPRLILAPMAAASVAFELFAPLVLLAPPASVSKAFALAAVSFHYGIAMMQRIDFVSFWGPVLALIYFDPAATAVGGEGGFVAAAHAAFTLAPVRTAAAATYVAAHVLAMVFLRFVPPERGDMLPFSPFAMYCGVTDLFHPDYRKWVYLTDKPHTTGTLKNYAFPMARPQVVTPEELDKLPFKYLLYGYGGAGEEVLYTNVDVSQSLRQSLQTMRCEGMRGEGVYHQRERVDALVAALDDAKAAFKKVGRRSAPAGDGAIEKDGKVTAASEQTTLRRRK